MAENKKIIELASAGSTERKQSMGGSLIMPPSAAERLTPLIIANGYSDGDTRSHIDPSAVDFGLYEAAKAALADGKPIILRCTDGDGNLVSVLAETVAADNSTSLVLIGLSEAGPVVCEFAVQYQKARMDITFFSDWLSNHGARVPLTGPTIVISPQNVMEELDYSARPPVLTAWDDTAKCWYTFADWHIARYQDASGETQYKLHGKNYNIPSGGLEGDTATNEWTLTIGE